MSPKSGSRHPQRHSPATGWRAATIQARPWLISMAVHTLGLLFLGLWVLPSLGTRSVQRLRGRVVASGAPLTEFSLAAPPANRDGPDEAAPRESPVMMPDLDAALKIEPISLEPDQRGMIPRLERAALEATPASPQRIVDVTDDRDATSPRDGIRRTDGVAGAAEVVTEAIRGELGKGDTLVVWLLDASISLAENRESLAHKTSAFYKSIDAFSTSREEYSGPHALMSSVVAFGKGWNEVLRPTRLGAKAVAAMIDVPTDTSGVENVMTAVNRTVGWYRGKRNWKQRLVLVILTDESGDDVLQLEPTIQLCRQQDVAVHVIGPSAVLGCQKGSQHCVLRQGNVSYSFWLTVNKGPETSLPERFLLPYWHESTLPPWQQDGATAGHSAWYGGSYRERLPSGFGPYALTRLALQTGGTFTMFQRWPMEANYDTEALRQYLPDYGSVQDYMRSIEGRPLRQFVSGAAALSFRQPELFTAPRLTFMGRRSPFYPYAVEHTYYSPADFRDQLEITLTRERRRVMRAVDVLSEFVDRLADSSIDWEYEYAKEESKRWRAWYDLTKGRLLATQARYLEYLATTEGLQRAISRDANAVTLYPAAALRHRDSSRLVGEATTSLGRCIRENPRTPWTDLARWELDQPLGLTIGQRAIPRPPPRVGGGTRSPRQFSFPKL